MLTCGLTANLWILYFNSIWPRVSSKNLSRTVEVCKSQLFYFPKCIIAFFLATCFVFVVVLWWIVVLGKEGRGWKEWEERNLSFVLLADLWNDPSLPVKELRNSWATLRWQLESPRVSLFLSLFWLVWFHRFHSQDVQSTRPWWHPIKHTLSLKKTFSLQAAFLGRA